jgi:hypothetical protein
MTQTKDHNQTDEGLTIEVPSLGNEPGTSPVVGLDWQTFRNFVVRALAGDESVPPAISARVNSAAHGGESKLEEKDRSWWQAFLWQQMIQESLRQIDGLIGKYNAMAEWHHEQAEKARARMQEAADKLEAIDEFIGDADDVFNTKGRTGKFDRDKAIKALKNRGVDVSANEDDESLLAKLTREKQKALRERTVWSEAYGSAEGDVKRHTDLEEENRRKAEELIQRRDAVKGGGYDPQEEARRLGEIAEEYEADVRRKAALIEKQRNEQSDAGPDLKETSIEAAKELQSQDEESEFLTSLARLTPQFAAAAANRAPTDPEPTPPTLERPKPTGPGVSA